MVDLKDKILLITGGGTGIGAAIAVGAAKHGAKAIIINYSRSEAEAKKTAKAIESFGCKAELVQGDVSEDSDCRKIANAAQPWGRIDALVNCAGITKHGQTLDTVTKDDFLKIYAVNTVGPIQMVRACKTLLESSGAASVLLISTLATIRGEGSSLPYIASKGALNALTLTLARMLAPNVRVNAVCPGVVDTRWFSEVYDQENLTKLHDHVKKNSALKKVMTAEDVADPSLFLISSAARSITGQLLIVDNGRLMGS